MTTPREDEQAQVELDDESRDEDAAQQEKRIARADLATRAFVLFVITSLTASMATLAFMAVQDHERIEQNNEIQQFIKDQSVENGQIGQDVKALAQSIQSCTTPGGDCYDRSQEQTSEVVADINRIVILAASCASGPGVKSVEAISACVVEGLAE